MFPLKNDRRWKDHAITHDHHSHGCLPCIV
jgi:hypothetical protein